MANLLYDALFSPRAGKVRPLLHLANGGQITAAEFHALTARLSHALHDAGVVPGDRVLVQVAKSPEALALYGARLPLARSFASEHRLYRC